VKLSSPKIYLELDGQYFVVEGGGGRHLQGLDEVKEEGLFVSDLPGSISRVLQVQAPPKFAYFMARRKVDEEGEFDQPAAVIPHWQKKKDKNITDILFTALPARDYEYYLTHIHEIGEPVVFFPLYGVLCHCVKQYGKNAPVAVLFQHGRTVDLLVGSSKRIYFAARSVAFEDEPEQVQGLWDMVLSDIRAVESENLLSVSKLIVITWIHSQIPPWQEEVGFEVVALPEEEVVVEDTLYKVSLPGLIRQLSLGHSVSGTVVKWAYRARRAIVPLDAIVLFLVFMVLAGHLYFTVRARALDQMCQVLRQEVASGRKMIESQRANLAYGPTLRFLKGLQKAYQLPSYKELVNDLSDAFGRHTVLELLKADYSDHDVKVEVKGGFIAPFGGAHQDYAHAMKVLRQKGYEIKETDFSTTIDSSNFRLKMVKRIS